MGVASKGRPTKSEKSTRCTWKIRSTIFSKLIHVLLLQRCSSFCKFLWLIKFYDPFHILDRSFHYSICPLSVYLQKHFLFCRGRSMVFFRFYHYLLLFIGIHQIFFFHPFFLRLLHLIMQYWSHKICNERSKTFVSFTNARCLFSCYDLTFPSHKYRVFQNSPNSEFRVW